MQYTAIIILKWSWLLNSSWSLTSNVLIDSLLIDTGCCWPSSYKVRNVVISAQHIRYSIISPMMGKYAATPCMHARVLGRYSGRWLYWRKWTRGVLKVFGHPNLRETLCTVDGLDLSYCYTAFILHIVWQHLTLLSANKTNNAVIVVVKITNLCMNLEMLASMAVTLSNPRLFT